MGDDDTGCQRAGGVDRVAHDTAPVDRVEDALVGGSDVAAVPAVVLAQDVDEVVGVSELFAVANAVGGVPGRLDGGEEGLGRHTRLEVDAGDGAHEWHPRYIASPLTMWKPRPPN